MDSRRIKELVRLAFDQAELSIRKKDAPFGAIASDSKGRVLASGRNRVNSTLDPSAHAEISLLRQLAKKLGKVRFDDIHIFISSEPCSMCTSALIRSGIRHIYYGAAQEKKQWLYIGAEKIAKAAKRKIFIQKGILEEEAKAQIERGRKSFIEKYNYH